MTNRIQEISKDTTNPNCEHASAPSVRPAVFAFIRILIDLHRAQPGSSRLPLLTNLIGREFPSRNSSKKFKKNYPIRSPFLTRVHPNPIQFSDPTADVQQQGRVKTAHHLSVERQDDVVAQYRSCRSTLSSPQSAGLLAHSTRNI